MKPSFAPIRLGANIRKARERKGVSQETLAHTARVNRSYLGEIERGKGNPSVKMITRIANKLGVRVKDLLDFETPN